MLRWFRRQDSKVRITRRKSTALLLEALEGRDCPSGGGHDSVSIWVSSVTYGAEEDVTVQGSVASQDPSGCTVNFSGALSGSTTPDSNGLFSFEAAATALGEVDASATDGETSSTEALYLSTPAPGLSLSVTYGTGTQVTLSGQVSSYDPPDCAVTFTGAAAGSVTPDAQGNFSLTTNASSLSAVFAQAVDPWGQASDETEMDLSTSAPGLSLSVTYGTGTQVTLSGQVSSYDPQDCTVMLAGPVGGTVTPDSDGNFSLTTNAAALGPVVATAVDSWGQSSSESEVDLASAAPTVTLSVGSVDGTEVTLTGNVSAPDPQSCTVNLSGAVAGSATPDASGNFSFQTTTASLGAVFASATDAWGQTSDTAQVDLTSPNDATATDNSSDGSAPQLTVTVSYGTGQNVTLTGHVDDADPESCTVIFSGPVDGQVTPDANGAFSFQAQASGLGTIAATAVDASGQNSDEVDVTLASAPPVITTFRGVELSGGNWSFQGQVSDESVAGLTVSFNGISCLQGQQATTEANGWFYLNVVAGANDYGTVAAQVTDCWGQTSATAYTQVQQS